MSREKYELSEETFYEGLFSRGAGDPDAYGYPGEQTNKEGDTTNGTDTEKEDPKPVVTF